MFLNQEKKTVFIFEYYLPEANLYRLLQIARLFYSFIETMQFKAKVLHAFNLFDHRQGQRIRT